MTSCWLTSYLIHNSFKSNDSALLGINKSNKKINILTVKIQKKSLTTSDIVREETSSVIELGEEGVEACEDMEFIYVCLCLQKKIMHSTAVTGKACLWI